MKNSIYSKVDTYFIEKLVGEYGSIISIVSENNT